DKLFSWMPLTHDMGMIGFHLTAIVVGMHHTIMDTATFVRRPLLWLSEASNKRATILCSPNFGYKHFLKVFESKGIDALDLSPVRLIFNGAEPISVDICRQFMQAMQPFGLADNAMFPVYGLAEASLAVSFPEPQSPLQTLSLKRDQLGIGDPVVIDNEPAQSMTFVLVGKPIRDCHVRITDDDNTVLSDGHVGHIQLKGDNVTAGYYHEDEINRQLISDDGWLDTGDSGAFVDGQMVITGRVKDIIFVNGLNFYSHDLENILHPLDELELGKVVVDGARKPDSAEDELIVYVLHRGDIDRFMPLAQKIRKTLNTATGVEVQQVIPVKRIPKTTSGKVQRHRLTDEYLAGDYNELIAEMQAAGKALSGAGENEAANDIEAHISEICRNTVSDKTIGLDDNLFEIGISSLALAEIHEQLEADYPGKVEISDLFDHPTIRQLAAFLQQD
ncbi:MAG TPA: AMP-dependent synthetase, partial [Thiotrichales bacterium]|nr:AMP-dependent synthetase [Thiotrichales bacterium]